MNLGYIGNRGVNELILGGRSAPKLSGGVLVNDDRSIDNFFNSSALAIPDKTAPFGDLGRNVARSHDLWQLDLGVHKEFPLPREGARAEFLNLLNRTNSWRHRAASTSAASGRSPRPSPRARSSSA